MSEIITTELTQLAEDINAEHNQCLQAMRASLNHALKVGDLLNQAKTMVQHGDWLPWIAANCVFSERTARAYMRVNRYWPELSKTATTADLTIFGALQLLQESTDVYEPGKHQERTSGKTWRREKVEAAKEIITVLNRLEILVKEVVQPGKTDLGEYTLAMVRAKIEKIDETLEEYLKAEG